MVIGMPPVLVPGFVNGWLCKLCTLVVLAVGGRQVLKIFTTGFCLKGDMFAKMAWCCGLYLIKPTVFNV
jgi:hypothetical protein